MTLILNGTDNSATTPAVTGTDTDTGVYYPAANQVALATNGTQALIVNSTQQVGIGVAPSVRFQVLGAASGATAIFGVGANGNGGIIWRNATDNSVGYTQVNSDNVEYRTTNDSTGVYMQKAGLTFPATQFPSADANTLDDYEEGTWSPAYSSTGATFSYSVQYGSYVKIGQMVYIQYYILATASGTVSNGVSLTGFPFTNTNNSYAQAGGCVWFSGAGNPVALLNANGTSATPYINGSTSVLVASDVNSKYWVGSFSYRAAS